MGTEKYYILKHIFSLRSTLTFLITPIRNHTFFDHSGHQSIESNLQRVLLPLGSIDDIKVESPPQRGNLLKLVKVPCKKWDEDGKFFE